MTIKELKEVIADLPDHMNVGLMDMSTDDTDDSNYPLKKENFEVMEYTEQDDPNEVKGEMLFIVFTNKLNENPI